MIKKAEDVRRLAEVRDYKRPMEFGPARIMKYLHISW